MFLDRHLPNGWKFGLPNVAYRTGEGIAFDVRGIPPGIEVPVFADADVASGKEPRHGEDDTDPLGRRVSALNVLALVHIFDVALVQKQVRFSVAIQFQARTVIPFDHAFEDFSILQRDDHRRLRLHLFDVVEVLRVRLIRWDLALLWRGDRLAWRVAFFLELVERRADQFPVAGLHKGSFLRWRNAYADKNSEFQGFFRTNRNRPAVSTIDNTPFQAEQSGSTLHSCSGNNIIKMPHA